LSLPVGLIPKSKENFGA